MNSQSVQYRSLGVYRHEGSSFLVELKLRDVRQLFNTLDPSPFHEKDLDAAAEEYLVSAMRELGNRPAKLRIHVPASTATEETSALAAAIRNYFAYRARHTRQQLRVLLRRGLLSLAIAVLFLFLCLSLRQWALGRLGDAAILSEGLLILGWVAMWRPVETFLYEWWPELGRELLFNRIAAMPIEVRAGDVVRSSEPKPASVAVAAGGSDAEYDLRNS